MIVATSIIICTALFLLFFGRGRRKTEQDREEQSQPWMLPSLGSKPESRHPFFGFHVYRLSTREGERKLDVCWASDDTKFGEGYLASSMSSVSAAIASSLLTVLQGTYLCWPHDDNRGWLEERERDLHGGPAILVSGFKWCVVRSVPCQEKERDQHASEASYSGFVIKMVCCSQYAMSGSHVKSAATSGQETHFACAMPYQPLQNRVPHQGKALLDWWNPVLLDVTRARPYILDSLEFMVESQTWMTVEC